MIKADYTTILKQSSMAAHEWLINAIKHIDSELGKGYAADHPELIASFMEVAAKDNAASITAVAIQELGLNIKNGLKGYYHEIYNN